MQLLFGNLRAFFPHRMIVAGYQKSTGTEPGHGAGNADAGVADHGREAYGGGDAHDQLDHAGQKGRLSVSHALNGGAVDSQQS